MSADSPTTATFIAFRSDDTLDVLVSCALTNLAPEADATPHSAQHAEHAGACSEDELTHAKIGQHTGNKIATINVTIRTTSERNPRVENKQPDIIDDANTRTIYQREQPTESESHAACSNEAALSWL